VAVGEGRGGGGLDAMNEATQSFLSGWDDSEASEWILLNKNKEKESLGFICTSPSISSCLVVCSKHAKLLCFSHLFSFMVYLSIPFHIFFFFFYI